MFICRRSNWFARMLAFDRRSCRVWQVCTQEGLDFSNLRIISAERTLLDIQGSATILISVFWTA